MYCQYTPNAYFLVICSYIPWGALITIIFPVRWGFWPFGQKPHQAEMLKKRFVQAYRLGIIIKAIFKGRSQAILFMSDKNTALSKELFTVGAHFGYSKTRRHPTTAKYLFAKKNKVDIIDVEHTTKMLEDASEFMKTLGSKGKTVIFVGTKPESKASIQNHAESLGQPYVITRWVGGIITNYSEIKKRLNRLEELRTARANGDLQKKYTKKELLLIVREIEKMESLFSGLVSLKGIPDALLIVDPKKEINAVLEANRLGIPVVAIANTDCDLSNIKYPILANDSSRASIEFIVKHLTDAYKGQ